MMDTSFILGTKKQTNVLVWAVYPPGAGWRGEGITQTVENILLHSPDSINYTLVISSSHLVEAQESLLDKKNITIVPLGFSLRKLKVWQDSHKLLRANAPAETLTDKIIQRIDHHGLQLENILWRLLLPIAKFNAWRYVRKADVIYNPSPTYSLTSYKKKPKVSSFWDPFVFEYTAFGKQRRRTLHELMYKYIVKSHRIITQSDANLQYLTQVWNQDARTIDVIHNGSPDYSEIFSNFCVNQMPKDVVFSRATALQYWPRRESKGTTKYIALDTLLAETLNASMLYRLLNSISEESKLIVISTQYRPYKGFEALFTMFDALIVTGNKYDFRFILTAELPEKIRDQFTSRYPWFVERVYELTRLSNAQHACLYKISDITLQPSFVEGGPTQYPASEAATLNIPSLTNIGRHTREMIKRDGAELMNVTADFLKKDQTISAILHLLENAAVAKSNIELTLASRVSWHQSSLAYATCFNEAASSWKAASGWTYKLKAAAFG
jgi:hypothetical protein